MPQTKQAPHAVKGTEAIEQLLRQKWPDLDLEQDDSDAYVAATLPSDFAHEFEHLFNTVVALGIGVDLPWMRSRVAAAVAAEWNQHWLDEGEPPTIIDSEASLPLVLLHAMGIKLRVKWDDVTLQVGETQVYVNVAHAKPSRRLPYLSPELIRKLHAAMAAWYAAADVESLAERHRIRAKHCGVPQYDLSGPARPAPNSRPATRRS